MSFVWKPAIYKSAVLTELPKPINTFDTDDSWDIRQSKVPLKDGTETDGHSRNGTTIFIAGQYGKQSGTNSITEEAMFVVYADMLSKFDVSVAADKYELFIYHDVTSATYRKWKNCSTIRLKTSFGDDAHTIFQYSIEILADDPTIYSTGPGV